MFDMLDPPPPRHHPSFGRPQAVRGLDLFDTPPIALAPLFAHEPLLQGVSSVVEPFCGQGNSCSPCAAAGLSCTPATSSTAAVPIPRCSIFAP